MISAKLLHGNNGRVLPPLIISLGIMVAVGAMANVAPGFLLAAVAGLLAGGVAVGLKRRLRTSFTSIFLMLFMISFPLSVLDIGTIELSGYRIPFYTVLIPGLVIGAIHTFLSRVRSRTGITIVDWMLEVIALILLLGVMILSALRSQTSTAIITLMETGVFFLTYVSFSYLVTDFRLWNRLFWTYVAACSLLLAYGFFRYNYSPLHWYRLVVSTNFRSNQLAFLIETIPLILFGLAATTKSARRSIVFWVGFLFFGAGVALTYSRGAWLATVVGFSVFLLLSREYISFKRTLVFLGLCGVLLFVLAPDTLIARFISIFSTASVVTLADGQSFIISNQDRLLVLREYLAQIETAPLLGIGPNPFLNTDVAGEVSAHNSFVSMLVGSGFLALLLMLSFLLVHWLNLRTLRRRLDQTERIWADLLLASYATMLFHLFLSNYFFGHFFWILLALQTAAFNAVSIKRVGSFRRLDSLPSS